MKDFELSIDPVETYEAPEIPVFGSDNSALLKKLPTRWQKNAKIVACIGIAGTLALSGCRSELPSPPPHGEDGISGAYYSVYSQNGLGIVHNLGYPHGSYSGYSDAELNIRLHHGGMGLSLYVVHLTEQEAYGIIRARLETAGLDFSVPPPEYIIDDQFWWVDGIGLNLFDEQKNVAVTYICWEESNRPFFPWDREFAMLVEKAFAEQTGITVGAIYNPGVSVGTSRFRAHRNARNSRPELVRQLINQVDAFIFILQSEGILEPFPDVSIMIDDTPIIFGEHPVIINNYKMVPAPEIFEEFGMSVELDYGSGRIIARKDRISMRVEFSWGGTPSLWVNSKQVDDDIPVIAHNDKVLVPLLVVARAIGADVEWNEIAREFRITTN